MLKNAILDAKIREDFAEIYTKFTYFCVRNQRLLDRPLDGLDGVQRALRRRTAAAVPEYDQPHVQREGLPENPRED